MPNLKKINKGLHKAFRSTAAKVSAGVTAMTTSALAFAGATSPGAAIAGELAGGDADLMLIISACAVLLGILILWFYTKKAR